MILVDTSILIHFFTGPESEAALRFKRVLEQELNFG
jgi:predicted nucleic acid-binding protein